MLYLASASPRRQELMDSMPFLWEVLSVHAEEEKIANEKPADTVLRLSAVKAKAGANIVDPCHTVIGADTVVSIDGKTLGKPHSESEAVEMLSLLSGKTHQVYTGLTVISRAKAFEQSFFVKTDVTFLPMTRREINRYVASGEPMDKAGAYGIQGSGGLFVEKIQGDYYNIVGLPIAPLYGLLKENHLAQEKV